MTIPLEILGFVWTLVLALIIMLVSALRKCRREKEMPDAVTDEVKVIVAVKNSSGSVRYLTTPEHLIFSVVFTDDILSVERNRAYVFANVQTARHTLLSRRLRIFESVKHTIYFEEVVEPKTITTNKVMNDN